MIFLSLPPTNITLRAFWQSICLMIAVLGAAAVLALGPPAALAVLLPTCWLLYWIGLRRESLSYRLYRAVYKLTVTLTRATTAAILLVLHRLVLGSLFTSGRERKFQIEHPRDGSSQWKRVAEDDPGRRMEIIDDVSHLHTDRSQLPRYRETWIRRERNLEVLPLYPYLVLLHLYRSPDKDRLSVVPTKTYTLY